MAAGCASEAPAPGGAPAAAPSRAVVSGEASPGTIVMLAPAQARTFNPPAEARVMDQYGQQFLPAVLVSQVGQRVEFRSSEDVLHNVRVDEDGSRAPVFNVATPPFGMYVHTFDKAGYYHVSCDVHPAMRANILVVPTPYVAVADAEGRFTIAEVEPGAYTARAYGGAAPLERALTVAAPKTALSIGER